MPTPEPQLPPMPEPRFCGALLKYQVGSTPSQRQDGRVSVLMPAFDADQLRAYALAAVLEERERNLDDLRFVERWVNHHGQHPRITPQEVLSMLQHYPPIKAITKGYVDGVVPSGPDPWVDAERWRFVTSHYAEENTDLAVCKDRACAYGATAEMLVDEAIAAAIRARGTKPGPADKAGER